MHEVAFSLKTVQQTSNILDKYCLDQEGPRSLRNDVGNSELVLSKQSF